MTTAEKYEQYKKEADELRPLANGAQWVADAAQKEADSWKAKLRHAESMMADYLRTFYNEAQSKDQPA